MHNQQSILHRHPLLTFFIFAYAITWGGILIFLASIGFQFAAITMQVGKSPSTRRPPSART